MRRERRKVTGAEQVGPYTLLRVDAGGLDAGVPGQFFMLEAPGRLLPRPMSVCLAGSRRAGVPDRPDRPGDASPVLARARGGAARARPARQRLRPRRGAAAARRRRDRDRAAPVPLRSGSAARRRSSASAPTGTPRPPRSSRTPRSASSPSTSPSSCRTTRVTCSRAGRSRCSRRCARCVPDAPARLGGADGVRLRRLLRLRGRDRRRAEAPLRRRAGAPCCLTRPAASTR